MVMHSNEAPPEASIDFEQLLALLDKERGYYEAILDITLEEQGKLERHRPMSELVMLLKKKKILVACIEEIEKSVAPLRQHWNDRKDKSDDLSKAIQSAINTLDETLKETLDIDQANQKQMKMYLATLKNSTMKSL